MTRTLVIATLLVAAALGRPGFAQEDPAVPAARFAGTWVGGQAWALADRPPGSSQDQPVTLTLDVVEGKVIGTLVPFLGGDEGATIVDSVIVGNELRATAVVGTPAVTQPDGRRTGGPRGWKDPVRVAFVFRNDGVEMTGTADVRMGDVPWLKFTYELGKKRNRY